MHPYSTMTIFRPHGMSHSHAHTHMHTANSMSREDSHCRISPSSWLTTVESLSTTIMHACMLHAACCMLHAACCVLYGCDGRYDLVSFENKRTVDVWAKASPSREGRSNGICLNADYTKLHPTTLETCIIIDVGWAARGEWLLSHGWLT